MRLPDAIAAVLLACVAFAPQAHAQPLPSHVNIDLLYVSSTRDNELARGLSDIFDSVRNRLASYRALGLGDAWRISIDEPSNLPQPLPMTKIDRRWRNRLAINILQGVGRRQQGSELIFEGVIYLGDFRGRLPEIIQVRYNLSAGADVEASTKLTYAILLYALSVDSRSQTPIRCRLLSDARGLVKRLPPGETTTALRDAIEGDISICGGRT
jgi:hypothetical protein